MIDISSTSEGIAGRLSNFTPRVFTFDGVDCGSMEGLLQSFKFSDIKEQKEVCKLVGIEAKKKGSSKTEEWKKTQILWWDGIGYKRTSSTYQVLLDRAFDALATNEGFCSDLIATGGENLKHSVGWSNNRQTILTAKEFCDRLLRIRKRLRGE
jgi:hypothetical protein